MTKGGITGSGSLFAFFSHFFCENQEYEKTEKTPRQRPNIFNPDCFNNAFFKAECAKDNSGGFTYLVKIKSIAFIFCLCTFFFSSDFRKIINSAQILQN